MDCRGEGSHCCRTARLTGEQLTAYLERERVKLAIAEAQRSGARLAQACRVIGISSRIVERWRQDEALHIPARSCADGLLRVRATRAVSFGLAGWVQGGVGTEPGKT